MTSLVPPNAMVASHFGNKSKLQADHVADAPVTESFSAPAAGAVAVVSNDAADLTTTADALEVLAVEVAALTVIVNAHLAADQAAGLMADS